MLKILNSIMLSLVTVIFVLTILWQQKHFFAKHIKLLYLKDRHNKTFK